MHQHPADRMVAQPLLVVAAIVYALRKANCMRIAALICKLGRVLEHQDRTIGSIVASSGRGEMAVEDITFLNIRVREKPISGSCAQSWQAKGMEPPICSPSCRKSSVQRRARRASLKDPTSISCLLQLPLLPAIASSRTDIKRRLKRIRCSAQNHK